MKRLCSSVIPALLLSAALWAEGAPDHKTPASDSSQPITVETRFNLVRNLNAEIVLVKKSFPQGEKGLTIKGGVVTPDAQKLAMLVANKGPAARAGERAQITAVDIRDDKIIFEINGGPKKKAKWYQRIQIGGSGRMTPIAQGPNPDARGSYVALLFDKRVPNLSVQQVKQMLAPVFDFNSKSPTQTYEDTLPPKLRAAVKEHRALVGMSREQVIAAKGRPERKIRERDGQIEYEEWIYGNPPQDVEFIRFLGDEVSQVKIMKMDGEKIVRTEREVDTPASASTVAQAPPKPAAVPTLRRQGEETPPQDSTIRPPGPVLVGPETDKRAPPPGTGGAPTTDPFPR